jgi:D-glycero-alpha-D-manno-heptose-7-phosphate kinase
VERPEELEHPPIVREASRLLGLGSGLEIVSIADLPANTGLGSSSSFTVGLLHALHAFKGESVPPGGWPRRPSTSRWRCWASP